MSEDPLRQRIRASALVVRHGKLLLVRHVVDDREWWCPPGGGVESVEPLTTTAERELFEETGLRATADRIAYVMDFMTTDPPCRNLEVYWLMVDPSGEPQVPAGESFLHDARFFSREDMRGRTVYPTVLSESFWDDLESGFRETRYLGMALMET